MHLYGMWMVGEAMHVLGVRTGIYEKSVLFVPFCCEPKIALNNSLLRKSHKQEQLFSNNL